MFVKPTKSGLFLLFLLFLFYIFSIMSQTGLMYIFMGLIIGLFVVNFIYGIKCIRSVDVKAFNELITTEGVSIDTKVQIVNTSSRTFHFIKLVCNFGDFINVDTLEGKSIKHVTPEIIFNKRGIYYLNKMVLETVNPFGLIKVRRTLNAAGVIKVYPELYYSSPPDAAGFIPTLGGHYKGKHNSFAGDDFTGIRKYIPGDPVKFIHWKASSKGLGVFVKEFTEEYSGKVSVVIQSESNTLNNGEDILDWGIRAAGSLIFSALDIGHNVDIFDYNNKDVLNVSPFSNLTLILEFLTAIEDKTLLSRIDLQNNNLLSKIAGKSSVVFIVTKDNPEFINCINRAIKNGRKVTVYFPFEAVDKRKIADSLPLDCKKFIYKRSEILINE